MLYASIIITCISIILLVIYGADVANVQANGTSFLPFDEKTRGLGLGIPSIVLPIAGFFISRKERSKTLGILIIIAGILIVGGGITVLSITDFEQAQAIGRNPVAESGPLIGIGGFIVALGSIKLKK